MNPQIISHPLSRSRSRTLGVGLNALAISFALAFSLSPDAACAQSTTPTAINIPAQSLNQALLQLGQQTDIQIYYLPETVAGRQAPAVAGTFTAEQALQTLLRDTGIQVNWNGKTASLSQPQAGATQFAPIVVTGSVGSTTEGTGAYTATGASSTATGLGLTLRETPQSVTVVTRQRLDDQKLDSVIDALENTTGVTAFRQGMGTDLTGLWSRGFSVSNVLVDGIPSALGASNYWRNTAMYDRIEVVRGATGLMTGMGSPAASVNLVRKRPTADTQLSLTAEVGSWDRYGLGADLSGALTDDGRWRGRLVVDDKKQRSWIDRYQKNGQLIYGISELDLSNTTLLTVGFSHETNKNEAPLRTGLPLAYSNGMPTQFKRSANTAPDWSFYDSRVTNLFASVQQDFGQGWTGKVEVTHTRYHYDSALYFLNGALDQATGQGTAIWPVRWQDNTRQTTLDAQIGGTFDWLGQQHDIVAGVSLSQLRADTPSYGGWVGPWTGYDGTIDNFPAWDGSLAMPVFVKSGDTDSKETQLGAYVSSRFKLGADTSLIAGARVINWERNAEQRLVGVAGSTDTQVRENGVIVPYAGLVHDLNEHWSVYGSFTRIFSPQAATVRDINNNVLDPERGASYELGIKSSFLDQRLNTSLALFRTTQTNLANYDATTASYVALQGIRTKGVEAELTGALTRDWNVSVGYTYSTSVDAQGARAITNIPQHSLKLFTTYRLPGALDKLTVGGGVNWQSASGYVGEAQQSPYAIASVMARYAFSPRFSAALNVNNLFDKTYYSGLSAYGGVYGAPRNVMLTARYTF